MDCQNLQKIWSPLRFRQDCVSKGYPASPFMTKRSVNKFQDTHKYSTDKQQHMQAFLAPNDI